MGPQGARCGQSPVLEPPDICQSGDPVEALKPCGGASGRAGQLAVTDDPTGKLGAGGGLGELTAGALRTEEKV